MARNHRQAFLPGEEPTFGISQDPETGLISGVYMIWSLQDVFRRVYIGGTVNLKRRWKSHVSQMRSGEKSDESNSRLRKAWQLYASHSFVFETLEWVEPDSDRLDEWEQYYLDIYQAADPRYGWNVEPRVSPGHRNVCNGRLPHLSTDTALNYADWMAGR